MTNTRMRFLLIIDTHGKSGIIDELAAHVRADEVIHAGGFGFLLIVKRIDPLSANKIDPLSFPF